MIVAQQQNEHRFVGEIISLVDNVGQSVGWWEGQSQPAPVQPPPPPPPKDYTNLIIGIALGLGALAVLLIVLSKKL